MKLEKAIEIGGIALPRSRTTINTDYYEALKILIEAGKRIQDGRQLDLFIFLGLLPGETEE